MKTKMIIDRLANVGGNDSDAMIFKTPARHSSDGEVRACTPCLVKRFCRIFSP